MTSRLLPGSTRPTIFSTFFVLLLLCYKKHTPKTIPHKLLQCHCFTIRNESNRPLLAGVFGRDVERGKGRDGFFVRETVFVVAAAGKYRVRWVYVADPERRRRRFRAMMARFHYVGLEACAVELYQIILYLLWRIAAEHKRRAGV